MGNTTLPIPIEITLDILQRCGRHDVYSFARTSKGNYDISVHLLYKHIDLVIALESEALERHEKYGVYDFVQIVDLPIGFSCPEFFTDPLTDDPTSDIQEALRKFKNIRELHIIIAEENYSKTCPTARILRWVFSDYVSRLSTLFLEIYSFSSRDQEFRDLLMDVSTFKNDPLPTHDNLKTIKTWVTDSQPRKLMSYISPLLSPFVSSLETIEIRVRRNFDDDTENDLSDLVFDYTYLNGLGSDNITSAFIEDKQLSSAGLACKYIARAWPNLVELDLDLGIDQFIFLLLALYLWLSCFDFVSARRKTPTAAANQDNPPWYHPPDFYVTAQEWDDFIKPPKDHNYLEDPVWYIFHGGYILRDFSRQQEMLATILANYTGDNTWLDFRTQYFKIIAPLTTEWYPINSEVDGYPNYMQKECRVTRRKLKNSYKEKIETHLTIDIPP
ncbi:hypothetical protein TWF970_001028 [Orbilia oligospora]|uniref:F-box domain-containing protein n=1 Tax=Orbilia oligospora TaxID=2813651 RepID=A0A7C8RC56_ORBOL|nr:hypothetical protein TWF970_001028 [Orbilia oligospora]